MPRYKIKFDIRTRGEIIVPAKDEADAEDYLRNQLSDAHLYTHCEMPEIDIEFIDEEK